MFKRILLPTDGSSHALAAARIAADLAKATEGRITAITAVEYEVVAGGLPEEIVRTLRGQIKRHAEEVLGETVAAVQERGAAAEARIVEGHPASAILAEAERGGYDVIVMGSRGITEAAGYREYVGSVTLRVLARASIPVLVMPPPAQVVD
ncbi:MAG: universal stress protein [Armatimonadetes bacterium]|nr:universal stress protein [Armatimonadota bacterium]